MKFKTDENMPEEAAELFRNAGHDAVTVAEQGIEGEPDWDLPVARSRWSIVD